MNFREFLTSEDVLILEKANPGVALHLSHLEDLAVEEGKAGFVKFEEQVINLLQFLQGLCSPVKLNLKVDGSPALFFGLDPRPQFKGQFFVGTKSAFNVGLPKINHSDLEIETNHTGPLVDKLKNALHELGKAYDGSGKIYQGDMLFSSHSDKFTHSVDGATYLMFKPNVLVYAIPVDPLSELFNRVNKATVGIILHDSFKGTSINDGKSIKVTPAGKNFEQIKELGKQQGVFIEDSTYPSVNLSVSSITQVKITELLKQTSAYIHEISDPFDDLYKNSQLLPLLKMYLNFQVRSPDGGIFKSALRGAKFNEKVFKSGFSAFLEQRFDLSTAKKQPSITKIGMLSKRDQIFQWIEEYSADLNYLLRATYSMLQIKNELLKLVNEIEGKIGKNFYQLPDGTFQATKGEGFVAFLGANQVKLVDRLDFSKTNLLQNPKYRQ